MLAQPHLSSQAICGYNHTQIGDPLKAIYKSIAARPMAIRPPKPEPKLLAALAVTAVGADVIALVEATAGVVGVTKGIVVAVTPKVIGVVGGGAVPVEVVTTGMLIMPELVALYV
jgi:hypothetical protein